MTALRQYQYWEDHSTSALPRVYSGSTSIDVPFRVSNSPERNNLVFVLEESEVYRADMVAKILDARDAAPVEAPAEEKAFLEWLNN